MQAGVPIVAQCLTNPTRLRVQSLAWEIPHAMVQPKK